MILTLSSFLRLFVVFLVSASFVLAQDPEGQSTPTNTGPAISPSEFATLTTSSSPVDPTTVAATNSIFEIPAPSSSPNFGLHDGANTTTIVLATLFSVVSSAGLILAFIFWQKRRNRLVTERRVKGWWVMRPGGWTDEPKNDADVKAKQPDDIEQAIPKPAKS